MPRAYMMIHERQPYPYSHFAEGLRAAGYDVRRDPYAKPNPDDVLLIWNRMGAKDHVAKAFEAVGAAVLVAENGWIGKAADGGKLYALCLNHHNGAGDWFVGESDRLLHQRIQFRPWRERGDDLLVLCSRGIGEPGVAQPRDWPITIARDLRQRTNRNVRVRLHPGDKSAPMDDDLRNVHAAVTWGSGAAIKALAAGIPIFYGQNRWIGAGCAIHGVENIEGPYLGDRLPMFRRLAWAQWSAAEIASGEPIRCLLKWRSTRSADTADQTCAARPCTSAFAPQATGPFALTNRRIASP